MPDENKKLSTTHRRALIITLLCVSVVSVGIGFLVPATKKEPLPLPAATRTAVIPAIATSRINVKVVGNNAWYSVEGETNLPEQTEVRITIDDRARPGAIFDTAIVNNGHFVGPRYQVQGLFRASASAKNNTVVSSGKNFAFDGDGLEVK